MIQQNPFTSQTFTKIWCQHFNKGNATYSFGFISGISFLKPSFLPLYMNVGKTLTKGMSYFLSEDPNVHDFKKKVFLIYDVPAYFNVKTKHLPKKLRTIKIKQYPGFLTNLEQYPDFNGFFSSTFNKKSRYKLKSYQRTLENSFNISYKHFYGDISVEDYQIVFDEFNSLLKKRFEDKQETNNNLEPQEWGFYKDSTYPLIRDKKASLFVIYQDAKPIAMSLNYFSESILFFAMTVFDIDYYKFNIGKVHLMKLYQWCFDENIKIVDLSKGDYGYKERWTDLKYHFEHHIYYDAHSITAVVIAQYLKLFFKLKQFLRDKELNKKLHKITFFLKKSMNSS
ncbi:GNAT family N-acetyltransferase [Yeosuana sp.]|uniref:GNAT family N-acetyltransferase n=1 Tax=Yeosuana sp. TaxID=2529388 RepID=UPI004054E0BF